MLDDKILGCIGLLVITILVSIIASVINGWVPTVLWGWFIVPVFSLPALTIVQAIGVALIITFLTRHSISSDSSKDWTEAIGSAFGMSIVYPLITLVIGRILLIFV